MFSGATPSSALSFIILRMCFRSSVFRPPQFTSAVGALSSGLFYPNITAPIRAKSTAQWCNAAAVSIDLIDDAKEPLALTADMYEHACRNMYVIVLMDSLATAHRSSIEPTRAIPPYADSDLRANQRSGGDGLACGSVISLRVPATADRGGHGEFEPDLHDLRHVSMSLMINQANHPRRQGAKPAPEEHLCCFHENPSVRST